MFISTKLVKNDHLKSVIFNYFVLFRKKSYKK